MNQQQVTIEEVSTLYNIDNTYHSDLMAPNYTVKAFGTGEADNRITLTPGVGASSSFTFCHSDPDRVIAIANMLLSFAQMAKNESKKVLTRALTHDTIRI